MTTISNDTRAATQRLGNVAGLSLIVLAFFGASAGCSQEFSSCSETRSCSEVEGGSAGAGGTRGGAGGSASSDAGAPSSGAGAGAGAGGACPGGCDDGETCCEGECVDTSSDVANCGACGHACEAGHAVSECVDSECAVSRCEEGFVDCAGDKGCETEDAGLPAAPSPFLPMAGAYTGAVGAERSLMPKFAWRAPEAAGTCGVLTYEIELTRECEPGKLQECAFEDPEVRDAGLVSTEFTPSEPLPVSEAPPVGSLYAWRVRACDAPERCSEWSRVSYVNVGRLIDDINADGYSEVVQVGADDGKQGMVFSGDGATPLAANTPLGDEIGEPFGGRFLGDVNGDEFPDLLLWGLEPSEPPRVILGASSPADWSSAVMSGPLQAFHRGARAGDLDGDGFADVAISEFEPASGAATKKGVVRLYRGRSSFSLAKPVNFVPPDETTAAQFGAAVEGGLDADADGYPDLFILDNDDGSLYRVRGNAAFPSEIDSSTQSELLVATTDWTLSALVAVGDREGDGYDDLAVSLTGAGGLGIHVFSGGPELPAEPAEPAASFVVEYPFYVTEWVGGADLGSDGRADLVVHALETVDGTSRLYVLPGSAEGQDAEDLSNLGRYDVKLNGAGGLAHGDYDGDGVIDLTLGEGQGGRRRLLRGGKLAQPSEDCPQSAATFPAIGDWCSVENVEIAAPGYVGSPLR